MRNTLIGLAIFGAILAGAAAGALAQVCPAGTVWQAGACRAVPAPGPGGVVAGAANAAGAVAGGAVATAGAIAGGAINTAGQIVGGTLGAVAGQPISVCPAGMVLYADRCYLAR